MTLDNKIALLTLIRNKNSCNGFTCSGCHPYMNMFHRNITVSFNNQRLSDEQRYALLYKEAVRFAIQEGVLTEEELFEEIL